MYIYMYYGQLDIHHRIAQKVLKGYMLSFQWIYTAGTCLVLSIRQKSFHGFMSMNVIFWKPMHVSFNLGMYTTFLFPKISFKTESKNIEYEIEYFITQVKTKPLWY